MIYISRAGLDSLSGGPTNVDSARPKKSDAFQHGYIYAFSKIQSILGLLLYPPPGADLEVELVQLNHCDGVYSNY